VIAECADRCAPVGTLLISSESEPSGTLLVVASPQVSTHSSWTLEF
jgi:hypothetical protein